MAGNNEFDLLKERIDHLKEIMLESLKSVDQKHDRWQKVQDDDIKEQTEVIKEQKVAFSDALDDLNTHVNSQFKQVFEAIATVEKTLQATEKAIQIGDQKVVAELEKTKSEKVRYMWTTAVSVASIIVAIIFGILQI